MDKLSIWFIAATAFLAPWASVGVLHAFTGRAFGFGLQPAIIPLAGLVITEGIGFLRQRQLRSGETAIVVALIWTIAAAAIGWSLADMGLAGERPWAKSTKQLSQWGFFVLAAVAVARGLDRGELRVVQRALGLGLLLACIVAVAVAFAGPLVGGGGLLDTNPSIASGSDELYMGHSFTGIARLRAPMPEPLMFGSYLLAVVPLVGLAGFGQRGFGRWWRWSAAALGAVCLLGTWSRGAWLGAAATSLALGVLWSRGRFGPVSRRSVATLMALGLGAGLVAFSAILQVAPWDVPGLLVGRVGQSLAVHDMSNMTRVWSWKVALEMFLDAPAQGAGWGSYGFAFFRHATETASGAHFGWPVPNNLALLLLAESGLVGLVLWAATLAPSFRGLGNAAMGPLPVVLACATVGVLTQLATFSQWNLPHLWLLFGAGLWAGRRVPGEGTEH